MHHSRAAPRLSKLWLSAGEGLRRLPREQGVPGSIPGEKVTFQQSPSRSHLCFKALRRLISDQKEVVYLGTQSVQATAQMVPRHFRQDAGNYWLCAADGASKFCCRRRSSQPTQSFSRRKS